MKFKTTTKAIKENFGYIMRVGYCEAQNLLWYTSPVAYTCGVYGWNFDIYQIDGIAITTGYRGMIGTRFDKLKKYEKSAEKILNDNSIPYEKKRTKIEKLLHDMISDFKATERAKENQSK